MSEMKMPTNEMIEESVDKTKDFCNEVLVPLFDPKGELDWANLATDISATLAVAAEKVVTDRTIIKPKKPAEKKANDDDEGDKIKARLRPGDEDVEAKKAACCDIGTRIVEGIYEYTDSERCAKELLVNIIRALCGAFDIEQSVIAALVEKMFGGEED